MTSFIRKVIQKYKKQATQLLQWSSGLNPDSLKNQSKRSDLLADAFLSMIVILLTDQEKVNHLTPTTIENKRRNILTIIQEKQKVRVNLIKRVFGLFIKNQFKDNTNFEDIYDEIQLYYEDQGYEETPSQTDLSQPAGEGEGDDDSQFQNFMNFHEQTHYSNQENSQSDGFLYSRDIPTASSSSGISKNSFRKQIVHYSKSTKQQQPYKSNIQEQQYGKKETAKGISDPHELKVMAYLTKLATPQTQLSYLCQNMGWTVYNDDQMTQQGYFQAKIRLNFQHKRWKEQLVASHVGKSKKIGRRVASFKLLRRIYLQYPSIWDLYQDIKQKKALMVPLNEQFSQQYQVISNVKLQEIQRKDVRPREDEFQIQKKEYLKNVASWKSQLNLLRGQYSGAIESPTMQKMQNGNSSWNVKGSIRVKFQGRTQDYREVLTNSNSKQAQEQIVKKLLQQVYHDFPEMLEKMASLKAKKGIKI